MSSNDLQNYLWRGWKDSSTKVLLKISVYTITEGIGSWSLQTKGSWSEVTLVRFSALSLQEGMSQAME